MSILDLSPVPSGGSFAQALRATLDLARHAEEAGYLRYWVAEHHLAEGVASSSPAVLIGAIASVTSRIRVGSGAVQLGHQTPLAVVEAFGTLASLYPGRIDLGLGRSGQRRRAERTAAAAKEVPAAPEAAAKPRPNRMVNGLLIPPPHSVSRQVKSPWYALQAALLQQPGAQTPDFAGQVDDIRAFLAGTWQSADGIAMTAVPGVGADAEVWILGSSAGQSAEVAGSRGLPFAASYHITPATALDAVEAYRAAFQPGARPAPHVMVSADVVVAPTDAQARELAAGFGSWVRSIRVGGGAIRYPSAAEARAFAWPDEDRALVADRIATQFAGSPSTVAKSLRILQEATGADELLVTTITHGHPDRVRSLRLLAREWGLG